VYAYHLTWYTTRDERPRGALVSAWPRLAFLLRVSAQSALNWRRTVAQAHDEKPKPAANAIIVELDVMWPSLKHTRRTLWIWKTLAPDSGQLLDWACGRRDKTTLEKRVKHLAQWDAKRYGTDQWVVDASVIPQVGRCRVKRPGTTAHGSTTGSGTSNASHSGLQIDSDGGSRDGPVGQGLGP
jgi:IS1 family transposase